MLIVAVIALVVGGLGAASGSWARGLAGMAAMLLVGALVAAIAHGDRTEAADADGAYGRAATRARAAPLAAGRPGRLARIVDLSERQAGDAHHLLRPILVEVSEEWLLATHDVGLRDPHAASLLPADLWAWVRPDRPRPPDPHVAGIAPADLDRLLDHLEALP